MDEHTIAMAREDDRPQEHWGTREEACKTHIAESNFDELTPEQQECVRERFAHFFHLVFNL